MKSMRLSQMLIAAAASLALAGCGSSSSSSGGSGSSFINWSGSANGTLVEDANGNDYRFDSSSGCMFGANTDVGPSGFCLTSTGSGFSDHGATNCSNPSSNSLCNTATFNVMYTDNPSGAGCIAVLAAGGANTLTAEALSVSNTGNGFDIQGTTSAGGFKVYWNGFVPVCGDSNTYAGSYQYASTGTLPPGTGCSQQFGNVAAANNLTSIDSGGVIDNDAAEFTGSITDSGTGSFTAASFGGGSLTFTITSAAQSGGKWVISGTGGDCTGSWSLTQQ